MGQGCTLAACMELHVTLDLHCYLYAVVREAAAARRRAPGVCGMGDARAVYFTPVCTRLHKTQHAATNTTAILLQSFVFALCMLK